VKIPDPIAMLEHSLNVARCKHTRGDISRASDMSARALELARNQERLIKPGGRSLRGTVSPSNAVKSRSPFEVATSGRTKFYQFNGKTIGGQHKVRVCKV